VTRSRGPRRSEIPPGQRARRTALVVLAACLLGAPRVRGDDAAAGRRHAQRASHLAAGGKCRQAIAEFDKAIAVLHDPTLLFNRGECHRKLGAVDSALEDYKQFLSDLPSAPNRAQVEARIAELGEPRKRPANATTVPPVVPAAPSVEARGSSGAAAASGLAVPAKATDGALSPSMTAQPAPNSGPAPAPSPAPDQPAGVALASPVAAESSSRGDSLASRP